VYLLNPEYDGLRDEGFLLEARLRHAGVGVHHAYCPYEEHGFINFVDIDVNAEREIEKMSHFFNKQFGRNDDTLGWWKCYNALSLYRIIKKHRFRSAFML